MKKPFHCATKKDYDRILTRVVFMEFLLFMGKVLGYFISVVGTLSLVGFYITLVPVGIFRLLCLLSHLIIALLLSFMWMKLTRRCTYPKGVEIIGPCDCCDRNTLSKVRIGVDESDMKTAEIVCSVCGRTLARQTWYIGGCGGEG